MTRRPITGEREMTCSILNLVENVVGLSGNVETRVRNILEILLLRSDVRTTFDALNNELNLVPDPFAESPLSYTPAAESAGKTFTVLGGDVTFTVSGVPANGDTFILSHNAGGVADNRNALALAGIQLAGTLEAGTATLQEAYGQLITSVGVQTRGAQITGETFSSLLEQAQADRESTAGVNLDEEAADLIRFQQAYQAAARVVTIADSLFQTVLDAVRR